MNQTKRVRLILWAACTTVFLTALLLMLYRGGEWIGKNYTDSEDFAHRLDSLYGSIGANELNPIDRKEAVRSLHISEEEINEHRTRYGSLSDQIESIQNQYKERIASAKADGNEPLLTSLVAERNAKIEDITMNFESDSHIEEKIRKEKGAELNRYLNELQYTEDIPVAYRLTDVKTKEEFTAGDLSVKAGYRAEFSADKGFFKAYSALDDSRASTYDNRPSFLYDDENRIANPVKLMEGEIIIPASAFDKGSYLYGPAHDFKRVKTGMFLIWGAGLLALIALLTVLKFKAGWVRSRTGRLFSTLRIDGMAILFIAFLLIFLMYLTRTADSLPYVLRSPHAERILFALIDFGLFGFIPLIGLVYIGVNAYERYKVKGAFEMDAARSYTAAFFKNAADTFIHLSIGVQTLILLTGFFLAGIGFAGMWLDPLLFILYVLCVLFLGLPALYMYFSRMGYLNRILQATEAMAAGRLNEEIKVTGRSPLAKHAANLNNLREGVRISLTEQAKSERLKTELITNVSHDLRTPLTSIITYTDLLKDESVSAEDRAKYVDILDKKSQRLKTLIEDLFEVSKMASGNLELNRQHVDLAQLLQQAFAEHAKQAEEAGLDFRMSLPDEKLIAFVDGQRYWRAVDNLIVNAVKYSMPNTRVYATLQKEGDNAVFILKNITKYELGADTDELFERFKRADTSRHTDGSGLGLAIAQSIIDMHGGHMNIKLDGDLFKVTVTVPLQ